MALALPAPQSAHVSSAVKSQKKPHLPRRLSPKTAPLALSNWNCSLPASPLVCRLAGCSSRWMVQEALSCERAGERGEAFLALDSRGCVGTSGGAGKAGATNYHLAGRKWPLGRMFETPALNPIETSPPKAPMWTSRDCQAFFAMIASFFVIFYISCSCLF